MSIELHEALVMKRKRGEKGIPSLAITTFAQRKSCEGNFCRFITTTTWPQEENESSSIELRPGKRYLLIKGCQILGRLFYVFSTLTNNVHTMYLSNVDVSSMTCY